jgi:ribosomal protein L11 methyltransferase
MTWTRVRFTVPAARQEIALAMLADQPFSAFQEGDEYLDAYGLTRDCTTAVLEAVRPGPGVPWTAIQSEELPDENWNSRWESHFDPVILAPFCAIRATFHSPVPDVAHEIVIQPEMAFGTGHHATTRMMLANMANLDIRKRRVLDFGSGTAVLAILAARLGALEVDAVEIEGPACESARANLVRNGVEERVRIIHGDSNAIPGKSYDLVLANINRNVLVDESQTLDQCMTSGGIAVLSGFLVNDRETLIGVMSAVGWTLLGEDQELDWLAQRWQKPNP